VAIADMDGPEVAADFYSYLFCDPGCSADLGDSAMARLSAILEKWVSTYTDGPNRSYMEWFVVSFELSLFGWC
jgi:hypothetical protein